MAIKEKCWNAEVINKMISLGFFENEEEFCFVICDKNDPEVEYHIGVKLIQELSSLLLIVGNHGGGFNMVFLANDNMDKREEILREWINEKFTKEFSEYQFVRICVNGE